VRRDGHLLVALGEFTIVMRDSLYGLSPPRFLVYQRPRGWLEFATRGWGIFPAAQRAQLALTGLFIVGWNQVAQVIGGPSQAAGSLSTRLAAIPAASGPAPLIW